MASPSTWRWSWNSTTDSAFTHSSSSSILHFSLTRRNRRITHLTKFSLDQNPKPSSSSSFDKGKIVLKNKSIHGGRTIEVDSLLLKDEILLNELLIGKITKNEIGSTKGKRSGFGKTPLWRRILFASKKVRSIMLLNVIALVNGPRHFASIENKLA